MSNRRIKNIFPAVRDDIADLQTWRAMPTQYVDRIDPFLFLNHHGRQIYPPGNRGLPFGPHPHRGFETVTFIVDGDIAHRDSGGHESVIDAGGVQWMTAGRGLVHSETSSDRFKEHGGPLDVLQLWINLPARLKMTEPRYVGLQAAQIPMIAEDNGRAAIQLIAGQWKDVRGAFTPLVDITVLKIDLQPHGHIAIDIPSSHNVFFYVAKGAVHIGDTVVALHNVVDFSGEGDRIDFHAEVSATVILCHAQPFNEPVVSHGPFVMNTREEIEQAIRDYQAGKFGE